jgi:uncharacterized protein YjiS (DUF1127 family)
MNATLHHFGRAAWAAHAPFFAAGLAWLRHAWQQMRAHRARRRRQALLHTALAQLNDATLRDIGLHRSEIDSFWAESEGLAPPTRQRLQRRGCTSP